MPELRVAWDMVEWDGIQGTSVGQSIVVTAQYQLVVEAEKGWRNSLPEDFKLYSAS